MKFELRIFTSLLYFRNHKKRRVIDIQALGIIMIDQSERTGNISTVSLKHAEIEYDPSDVFRFHRLRQDVLPLKRDRFFIDIYLMFRK